MREKIKNKFFSLLEIRNRKIFYEKLIEKNDLVFDIGANHGNRTSTFLKIGADVIAIEPNPQLATKLAKKFGKKVKVLQKAVGAYSGTIDLYINDADVLSTTSKKWMDTVKKSKRFGELVNKFNTKIEVELVTLDSLFKEYGIPKFIKIDTEGLEYEIIKTIKNTDVYSLSFEFAIPETLEDTLNTINHLESIGYKYFNISFGESMEFITTKKINSEGMKSLLENLPSMSWGDIYAFAK